MKVKVSIHKGLQRLLFSYKSLIFIVVICIFATLSFYFTYQDKLEWVKVLTTSNEDINTISVQENIDNYVGIRFLSDYYFGDFSQMSNTFILIFIGIFISPVLAKFLNTGFGNFILARESYSYLLKAELLANVFYINILYIVSNFIVLLIGFGLGGLNEHYEYGVFSLNRVQQILVLVLNILLMSILISLITAISMSMNLYSNNEFILAMIPLSLYLILPLIISSTLGNIFKPISHAISPFIIGDFQNVIHRQLTVTVIDGNSLQKNILPNIAMLALSLFVAIVLIHKNIRKYKELYYE